MTAAWPVHLYFPGRDGLLYAESRDLEVTDDPQNRLRALVAGVLSGPHDSALVPALPADVQAQTVYLAPDGVAYVDLHSADRSLPPPSGSQAEMATVYSLVNSVGLNLPDARRIALLWNGTQLESFSGHLDTRHPLAPDTSLLARPQPASQ
ncbi:MAG: GerMN domain-containing protein [Acidobacteriota bacterium]